MIYIHTVVFASRIIRQMCLVFFGSRTVYVEPTERSWNGDSNHDTHYACSPKIDTWILEMRRQPLKIVLASYIAYGLYSKLSIVGRIEIECLCLVSICSAVEPHLCVCVFVISERRRE